MLFKVLSSNKMSNKIGESPAVYKPSRKKFAGQSRFNKKEADDEQLRVKKKDDMSAEKKKLLRDAKLIVNNEIDA